MPEKAKQMPQVLELEITTEELSSILPVAILIARQWAGVRERHPDSIELPCGCFDPLFDALQTLTNQAHPILTKLNKGLSVVGKGFDVAIMETVAVRQKPAAEN